eukprot:5318160-Pleurochrysis_carterae.AAC.2
MQQVIERGRTVRDRNNLSMRTPLPTATFVHSNAAALASIDKLSAYVMEELNVRSVVVRDVADVRDMVTLKCLPNHKKLGARFGPAYKGMQGKIRALTHEQLAQLLQVTRLRLSSRCAHICSSLALTCQSRARTCRNGSAGLGEMASGA